MRCKNHYTDPSSTVGVCACCLRERLLSVITAQEQQAKTQNQDSENPRFPRSVSPYTHKRKRNKPVGAPVSSNPQLPSSAPRHRHSLSDQLFYRTPEARLTSGVDSNTRSFIRLFSFKNIFRSRNRKSVDSVSDLNASVSSNSTSSFSWFSSIFHRRKQPVCVDESTATTGVPRRRHPCRDRGMSPVRNSGVDENENENENESNNDATREYESTESWKNTPRRTPARGGHARNLSGLSFCLSPLVRASPNRQWKQNGLTNDVVLSGENRGAVKPHLSNTKSFQANRSRKIADFGRGNQNR